MSRIYFQTVMKWFAAIGIPLGTVIGLFFYLSANGLIEVHSYSPDMACAGTELKPCIAEFEFTALDDIYIYPIGYDPFGRDDPIFFDKAVKSYKLQRSWGDGWRTIDLNKTWSSKVKYALKLNKGQRYKMRLVVEKFAPADVIKWGFSNLDPIFLSAFDSVNGDVIGDWSFANMTISPENVSCRGGDCSQVMTVCNKYEDPLYLFGVFDFDEGVIDSYSPELRRVVKYNVSVPTYGWVVENYKCNYSANLTYNYQGNGTNYSWCFYHDETNNTDVIVFEHFFNYVVPAQKKIWWQEWGINGSIEEELERIVWNDVTDKFTEKNRSGQTYYFNKNGLDLDVDECETWRFNYEPNTLSGKWNALFALHTSDDWTCMLDESCFKMGVIDPAWVVTDYNSSTTPNVSGVNSDSTQLLYLKGCNCSSTFSSGNITCDDGMAGNVSCYYNMCTRLMNASEDCSDIEVYDSDTDTTVPFIPVVNLTGASWLGNVSGIADSLLWDAIIIPSPYWNQSTNLSSNIKVSTTGVSQAVTNADTDTTRVNDLRFEPGMNNAQLKNYVNNSIIWSTSTATYTQSNCPKGSGCYHFDGSGDVISSTRTGDLTSLEGLNHSVSAWVIFDDIYYRPVYQLGTMYVSSNYYGLLINLELARGADGPRIWFFTWDGDSNNNEPGEQLGTSTDIEVGVLYHVVAVFDNTNNMKYIYLNGSLDNSVAYTGALNFYSTSGNCELIGQRAYNSGCGTVQFIHNGTIDDVRTYTSALTASEVEGLFNEGSHIPEYWSSEESVVAPVITMISPENESYFNFTNVTFEFNVSGNPDNCTLYINESVNVTNVSVTDVNNEFVVEFTEVANYTWNVTCENGDGSDSYSNWLGVEDLSFVVTDLLIYGNSNLSLDDYTSGVVGPVTYEINSTNFSEVNCSVSGSTLVMVVADGFKGFASCTVNATSSSGTEVSSAFGITVFNWVSIAVHQPNGSVYYNFSEFINKSVGYRCKAYDEESFSDYYYS